MLFFVQYQYRLPLWVSTVCHQMCLFSALLTCFFCFLSALASWATRCLCCSSKPLLSCLMRDSIGRGSGDRLHDCDGLNTNEGDAFEIETKYILNLAPWNFSFLIKVLLKTTTAWLQRNSYGTFLRFYRQVLGILQITLRLNDCVSNLWLKKTKQNKTKNSVTEECNFYT